MRRSLTTALTLGALPGGVALTAATATGARRLLAEGTASGGDPAAALTGLASLLAALLAGWLTLVVALALAARLPGRLGRAARLLRDRVTPAIVRRWAALVLGASVAATVLPGTAVAQSVRAGGPDEDRAPDPGWAPAPAPTGSSDRAAPTDLPAPGWTATSTSTPAAPTATAPGWTPQRPPARHHTDPGLLAGRPPAPDDEVVVHRGDSLWSIAARHLGPDATAEEISRAWPRWYSANAHRIGEDPHLILPGTRLTPPTRHDEPGATPATKGTR